MVSSGLTSFDHQADAMSINNNEMNNPLIHSLTNDNQPVFHSTSFTPPTNKKFTNLSQTTFLTQPRNTSYRQILFLNGGRDSDYDKSNTSLESRVNCGSVCGSVAHHTPRKLTPEVALQLTPKMTPLKPSSNVNHMTPLKMSDSDTEMADHTDRTEHADNIVNGRSKERIRGGYRGTRARSISLESNGNTASDRNRKPIKKKGRERNLSLDSVTSLAAKKEREEMEMEMDIEVADLVRGQVMRNGNGQESMDQSVSSDEQKEEQSTDNIKKAVASMTMAKVTVTTTMMNPSDGKQTDTRPVVTKPTVTKPTVAKPVVTKPAVSRRAAAAPLTPTSAKERAKRQNAGKGVSRRTGNDENADRNVKNRRQKRNGAGNTRQNKEPIKRKPYGAKPFTVSSLGMQSKR